VRPPGIVIVDPPREPGAQLQAGLKRMQVDTLVFQM
jgi:hypothetical protein